jgi:prophage antirepressor-like protein
VNALASLSFNTCKVRVFGTPEKPLFVASDVCEVLQIEKNRDAVARLPESCKGSPVVVDTLGGRQETTTITEAGVFRLIFKSKKPQAEAFQAWVTDEVLPEIRRTGSYGITPATAKAIALLRKYASDNKDAQLDILAPVDTYGTPSPKTGEPRTRFVRGHFTSRWAQDAITSKLIELRKEQMEFAGILGELAAEETQGLLT